MSRADGKSEVWLDRFHREGFIILENVLEPGVVRGLIRALEQKAEIGKPARGAYALRNLLEEIPAVAALAKSPPVIRLVESILGKNAFVVRGILFDKTPAANWKVAWHQDLTIAVKRRIEVKGFGAWSVKEGVQHVQPPPTILERMVAVRLHLDNCAEDNGPLQVLPASHAHRRLGAAEIESWRARVPAVPCLAGRGGALLMRPLLLHASSAARHPGHRRVIHLEFANELLPGGLEWLDSGKQPPQTTGSAGPSEAVS